MEAEEYASFLVRCWHEPPAQNQATGKQTGCGQQQGRWRGEIEHIQSGNRWCFATLTALLSFLQQAAARPGSASPHAGAKPVTEDDENRASP